jgi:hypothetical protein
MKSTARVLSVLLIAAAGVVLAGQDTKPFAHWYQQEPYAPFPKPPAKDELEII